MRFRATYVVNVKTMTYDIYIGRRMPGRPASVWANPFKIGRDGTRTEVLAKYRAYLESRPDLMAHLPTLRGRVLGCWCKPAACHGDILAELADAPAAPGAPDA